MGGRIHVGRFVVLAIGAVVALPGAAMAQQPPRADAQAPAPPSAAKGGVALADDALRTTVRRLARGMRPPRGVQVVRTRVRVEILVTRGERTETAGRIARLGGRIEGSAGAQVLQALVPADELERLERSAGVRFLRPPLIANALPNRHDNDAGALAQPQMGEEVTKTQAGPWHAAGITGTGVKVGIVDYFDGPKWNASRDAGEVPAPRGTFCQRNGQSCDVFASRSNHGIGVAEIIHEMAPDAAIYLATAQTAADLQAVVDYFAAEGVTIISRSLTAEYDGRGDGTGPIAAVMDDAVAKGMTWFNSAGNTAGRGSRYGSYWRGAFADSDNDRMLEFAPGDEALAFYCTFVNGVRWSDWGASKTDYDVYAYDDAGLITLKDSGSVKQGAALGPPPLEHLQLDCANDDDVDYLVVKEHAAGRGTEGDVLEFMVNGRALEYFVNPFSASGPASDSASPGALSIGAVDPVGGTEIASYSAEGPTNDNRVKPDLSAAACVASFSFAPDCFNGTSAATPVAAGAAALVLDSRRATTPAGVKSFLLGQAAVDRGAAGPDNVFGSGELVLPSPPPAPPTGLRAVTGGDSIVVDWRPRTASPPTRECRVYRDGSRIGTSTPGSTPNYADREGARYTDATIEPGDTYSYRVQTVDANGGVSALNDAVTVTAPVDTTPVPTITVDTSGAPQLAEWINAVAVPELRTWYPKVADRLARPGYAPPSTVVVEAFDDPDGHPAEASGNRMRLNADWFSSRPDDVGTTIHEAAHVIQSYRDDGSPPGWVAEGVADWARFFFYDERKPPQRPSDNQYYTDGYGPAAYFLNWMQGRYDSVLVRKLNVLSHDGRYSDQFFVTVTGKTLAQLWTEMTGVMRSGPGLVRFTQLAGKCLDENLDGDGDGADDRAQIWDCNGSAQQQWTVIRSAGEEAVMLQAVGRRCLDVQGGTTANGAKLQLWPCNGSGAQKWLPQADGTLINPQSGRCLDVPPGSTMNGTHLQLYDCNGGPAQTVRLPTSREYGPISGVNDLCVDIPGSDTTSGNTLQVWRCNETDAQQWAVLDRGDGSVTLHAMLKCLDVDQMHGPVVNGTRVQIWDCNTSGAQVWLPRADGSLLSPQSGKCLETVGGGGTAGTKLQVWDCNGLRWQKWRLPTQQAS